MDGKAELRKDVQVGEEVLVLSAEQTKTGKWYVKVLCTKDHEDRSLTAEHVTAATNLEVIAASASADPEPSLGMVRPPKGYAYIGESPAGTTFNIFKTWGKQLPEHDMEDKMTKTKQRVGFLMSMVTQSMPTYKESDLTFVQRKVGAKPGDVEVYAARDFKAHELILAADSTEMKHRMYTLTEVHLDRGWR